MCRRNLPSQKRRACEAKKEKERGGLQGGRLLGRRDRKRARGVGNPSQNRPSIKIFNLIQNASNEMRGGEKGEKKDITRGSIIPPA